MHQSLCVLMLADPKAGELQGDGPTFRACCQDGDVFVADLLRPQQVERLVQRKSKLRGAELPNLSLRAQNRQRQARSQAAGDHHMDVFRHAPDKHVEQAICLCRLRQVIVIQNEH